MTTTSLEAAQKDHAAFWAACAHAATLRAKRQRRDDCRELVAAGLIVRRSVAPRPKGHGAPRRAGLLGRACRR
jgi:hypothetical protein